MKRKNPLRRLTYAHTVLWLVVGASTVLTFWPPYSLFSGILWALSTWSAVMLTKKFIDLLDLADELAQMTHHEVKRLVEDVAGDALRHAREFKEMAVGEIKTALASEQEARARVAQLELLLDEVRAQGAQHPDGAHVGHA